MGVEYSGFTSNDNGVIIKRDMTITHDEFFRLLPVVFAGRSFSRDLQSIRATLESGSVEIKLAPEQRRRLGALELPLTEISLCFEGVSDPEYRKFLERFDRVYQKGGG